MRPLIVGEAPSRTSDPCRPIAGRCGARLADLAGLDERTFRSRFARANLLDRWPGPSSGKGARFPLEAARTGARALRRRFRSRRTVVLLGFRVARAFDVDETYFVEQRVSGARVVVVPHPSGVNRWFNDPRNVRILRAFLRLVAAEGVTR